MSKVNWRALAMPHAASLSSARAAHAIHATRSNSNLPTTSERPTSIVSVATPNKEHGAHTWSGSFGHGRFPIVGSHDEVLQQFVLGDGRLELGLGGVVGRDLAHVLGREREPAEQDVADRRFVRGCNLVHVVLPWMRRGTRPSPAGLDAPENRPRSSRGGARAGLGSSRRVAEARGVIGGVWEARCR